ncbi:extracellular solute-binding protein, family 3 [gamma proteobacterium HTCC5015]|nr:extracellular solute-binding protein, family 3 [gamma proteobacterium HTCC5015]
MNALAPATQGRRFTPIKTLLIASLLACTSLRAEDVRLATSLSIAPYINSETQAGPQLSIVRDAFALVGHNVTGVLFTSNERAIKLLRTGAVDAVVNIPEGLGDIHYSTPVLHYQNYAISLSERQLKIEKVSDLKPYSIVAFQRASQFLGEEFGEIAASNEQYLEAANQLSQVGMLFKQRTDVIVIDHRIFNYIRSTHFTREMVNQAVSFHPIFPSSPRSTGFTSAVLRDDFDRGLQQLKETGVYATYLEQLDNDSAP